MKLAELNEKISVFFNLAKQKISKAREALTPKANELKEKTKTENICLTKGVIRLKT